MLCYLFLFLQLASLVLTFSFTVSTPTECDSLTVQWDGGTAPFQLLMIPKYGIPLNVSVPDSAFSNGQGSYSTPLLFNQSTKLIITMSDSTSFGSGGSTDVLTVGASLGGSCDLTPPKLDFSYQLPNALQQCSPYVFSGYSDSGAVQPVKIMGVIPGGDSFVLKPPMGSNSYTWTADIYNDTTVVFVMVDALARQGGSSDFNTVLSSSVESCINASSPSSTMAPPVSTSTPSSTAPASSSTTTSTGGTPMPVIAASVIGALIFLAVFVTLGLFFLKRYRDKKKDWNPSSFRRDSYRIRSEVDLSSAADQSLSIPYHYPSHASNPANASAYPLFSPFPQSDSQSLSPAPYAASISHSNIDPFSPIDASAEPDPFMVPESSSRSTMSQSTMSSAQRKAAMAGAISYKPSRFILHTDIEDAIPPDAGEEVVELPPQYTERRNAPGPS